MFFVKDHETYIQINLYFTCGVSILRDATQQGTHLLKLIFHAVSVQMRIITTPPYYICLFTL